MRRPGFGGPGASAPSSGDVCVPQCQSEAVRHGHDVEEGYEFTPLAVDGKGEVDRRHYAVLAAEHFLHRLERSAGGLGRGDPGRPLAQRLSWLVPRDTLP